MWFYVLTKEDRAIPLYSEAPSRSNIFYTIASKYEPNGLVYVGF